MSWDAYHRQSEQFANQAQLLARHGHTSEAKSTYWKAAWQEMQALQACPPGNQQKLDTTAISVMALMVKADMELMAQHLYKNGWEQVTSEGLSDRHISDCARIEIEQMFGEVAA